MNRFLILVIACLSSYSGFSQQEYIYIFDKFLNQDVEYRIIDNDVNVDNIIIIQNNGYKYKRVFETSIKVEWFGAKPNDLLDDTEAFNKALSTGYSIELEKGIYLINEVKMPFNFKGMAIVGAGYNNWDVNSGTTLKSTTSRALISFENGCDWVKISNLRLEGSNKGTVGINCRFGAGLILENVGVYNFLQYGLLSRQGLLRINNCYFFNNSIGAEIYSDSSISDSEFSGGSVCLKLVAGGNRLNNCWINGALQNLLVLEPLDENTNHQNTSLTNMYVGEVIGTGVQVSLKGNKVRRVQQVQLSNSFFVHASATKGSNSFFYCENSDEIIINGCNFLGQHTYAKGLRLTEYLLKGVNSNNLKITNNIIKGINGIAIIQGNSCYDWDITFNQFIDFGGEEGKNSCILIEEPNSRSMIIGNRFIDYRSNKSVFAVDIRNKGNVMFRDNFIAYPNSKMVRGSVNDTNFNLLNHR